MENYEPRGYKIAPLQDWWAYWKPCKCGHLEHEHRMGAFTEGFFNTLRGGIQWMMECKKCECKQFRKGSINDPELVEHCENKYAAIRHIDKGG